MAKHIFLFSLMIYLISCTSNDNGMMHAERKGFPMSVNTSTPGDKSEAIQIKAFSNFLDRVSTQQMISAAESDLHEEVRIYLPDSLVSEGFDLHIHEIGRIDTFRLVFHEYFDLYDDWSKTYLDIFSPSGKLLQSKKMWELSFEGSTNINFINDAIIEIAYHDFFDMKDQRNNALIPDHNFYLSPSSAVEDRLEGTIYEYYKIQEQGFLKSLSQNTKVSKGRYFPQSSAKLLSQTELHQYKPEEIKLMKEELLAQRGYIFSELPTQNYFELQEWYVPYTKNIDSLLTDIEKLNLDRLTKIETEY